MKTAFARRAVQWLAAGMMLGGAMRGSAAADAYVQEIEAARAARVAQLTKPDGWLTLVGLDFLKPGENPVGSAMANAVVIANTPAHLGNVVLGADGRTTITLNPAAEARVEGREVLAAELVSDERTAPTIVSCGTVSFYVIDRNGRKALRVKDSQAERRTKFAGLDYFPIDPSWRIEADWVAFERAKEVPIANVLGQVEPALVPGKAVFRRDGKTYELLPIVEGPEEPLFFVISDATSGKETYAASRFLYADLPSDGKVILDFNLARNPPCAFTPFATCPLPPKENRLTMAVTAGEKKYRDGEK